MISKTLKSLSQALQDKNYNELKTILTSKKDSNNSNNEMISNVINNHNLIYSYFDDQSLKLMLEIDGININADSLFEKSIRSGQLSAAYILFEHMQTRALRTIIKTMIVIIIIVGIGITHCLM